MIRAVVSVGLATAVLAASLPAVEDARADRTGARLDVAVERIERAARELRQHEDATAPWLPGARRSLAVDLPERSWTAAGVGVLAVGARPRETADARTDRDQSTGDTSVAGAENGTLVATRVRGEPTSIEYVPVRIDGQVVIREGGRHRLTLVLVAGDRPTVHIKRAGHRSRVGETGPTTGG